MSLTTERLTIIVQAITLHEVNDVECVGGCGLHTHHTEVVPLHMLFGVEVRVQDQAVLVAPSAAEVEAVAHCERCRVQGAGCRV